MSQFYIGIGPEERITFLKLEELEELIFRLSKFGYTVGFDLLANCAKSNLQEEGDR